MRKVSVLLVVVAGAFAACGEVVPIRAVAHRGLWDESVAENTVAAIRRAYEAGADCVETDFHEEPDGRLMCYHDLGRVAKVRAKYADYRMPTLEEVLAVVPKDREIQAEIKTYGPTYAAKFVAAVVAAGLTPANVTVSSFDYVALKDFKLRHPEFPALWLIDLKRTPMSADKLIAEAKAGNFEVICPGCVSTFGTLSPKDVDAVKAAGLDFRVYGVNTPSQFRRAIQLGATGFTSDRYLESRVWAAAQMPRRGFCAHRGDRASCPENTPIAVRTAIEKGAEMVEFDLQRCKTGEIVVMHDLTVDRTTNGRGHVSEMTFDELRKLDAGIKTGEKFRGTRIPTLDEMLAVIPKTGVWINFHCYYADNRCIAEEVAEKLTKEGRLHQGILAANEAHIAEARAKWPDVITCDMSRPGGYARGWTPERLKAYIDTAVSNRCDSLQFFLSGTAEVFASASRQGLTINYFECDDPAQSAKLFADGVDFILTNDLDGNILPLVPQVRSFRASDCPLPPEGYRIRRGADGACAVEAADAAGRFYAEKTLKQLGQVKGPLEIEDSPAYRWRGIHLDESRHFFGKETVKKLIRTMADFKLNVLHWHIIDDSGWRLAIPGYPEVAQAGATRTAKKGKNWLRDLESGTYGPFCYTADDVREILAVAQENFVTVVPEVEIPGHAGHLLGACYPQFACDPRRPSGVFCLGNDEGLRFLETVADYVADLFPGEFVHIGGDEVNRKVWSTCEKCRARAKAEGLASTDALQNWVTKRFAARLKKKGKRIIGWDEIIDGEGLPADVAVMDWCGKGRGPKAAAEGHDVVMCPHWSNYFDYTQCVKDDPVPYPVGVPPVPVSKVYGFDPLKDIPADARGHVLGGQCCNWTEWTCTPEELEWKIWPRACAVAENYWTGPRTKDYREFARRLAVVRARLVREGVNAAPIAPEDGVDLSPRPKSLKLTLGTLTVPTNVVSAALCTFTEDPALASGAYRLEIHYDRGISVSVSDAAGRARAVEALKALARPDGRNLDELSFSCLEIED